MKGPLSERSIFRILIGLAMTLGAATVGSAATLHVSTTGNDSNNCLTPASACQKIQAAVNKAANGDTINVAPGTYAEVVSIVERDNLSVIGSPGVFITHPGVNNSPARFVLQVLVSRNIGFANLTITGLPETDGVRVFNTTLAEFTNCTVEGNGGPGGAFFTSASSVSLSDCTVQDNGTGIRVDGNASVDLNSTPFSNGVSTVQRNGAGVIVRAGVFFLHGAGVIQENGVGITGQGGAIKTCCNVGLRKIINNDTGILLRGDNLDLRGPVLMEGNRLFALRMFGGFATVGQGVTVRSSGTAAGAAIYVTGGFIQLGGRFPGDIAISDNPGNGVTLTDGAAARVFNTLISNNAGQGMRVQALSSVELFDTAVMSGNRGFDFSCTPNSSARGSDLGVKRMFCPGFDKSPDPAPGGPDNP